MRVGHEIHETSGVSTQICSILGNVWRCFICTSPCCVPVIYYTPGELPISFHVSILARVLPVMGRRKDEKREVVGVG
jgi:hypothetical protein